jgi:intracellular sulfur oxidation DsrE/DsrF family protein
MRRRAFVATTALGVGAAIAAAQAEPAPVPTASAAPASIGGAVPFHFDKAGFEAILAKPYPHRQLITAITYAQGESVPHYLANSLRAYADPKGFAAGPNALHCVAVLYGPAIAMVLDDAAWAKYPIGTLTFKDRTKPIAATSPDIPRTNPLLGEVTALVTVHDVAFFVCNNAFTGIAASIAKIVDGVDPSRERIVAVHDDLATHLSPGSMLVPAGVAAINAVQEAHFTYLPSF